eukprot:m.90745 g.90745  ORF g.90745 m.90745 type:complete len:630 (-) comp9877_c0_seq3:96-1985(-)
MQLTADRLTRHACVRTLAPPVGAGGPRTMLLHRRVAEHQHGVRLGYALLLAGFCVVSAQAMAQHHPGRLSVANQPHPSPPLPPVNVSSDGRWATVAPGTAAVSVGLYAMVFATSMVPSKHPHPMTASDYRALVTNGYIVGMSLHFTWADIQPLPPPAPYNYSCLTQALDMLDSACTSVRQWCGVCTYSVCSDIRYICCTHVHAHACTATRVPMSLSEMSTTAVTVSESDVCWFRGANYCCSIITECVVLSYPVVSSPGVSAGKKPACLPVFLKPYLAHEPSWVSPFPYGNPAPVIGHNALGMRVVVRPTDRNGTDLWNKYVTESTSVDGVRGIPISTDSAWRVQRNTIVTSLGQWLEEVDPNAIRVRVMHFVGPLMASLQMRPGPSELFPYLANTGPDVLGMNWTKQGHIDAWKDAATDFADAHPQAFAKRAWAFDFTVLAPSEVNSTQVSLDTAEQREVFEAVAAAHPAGPGAVIAKTESLHVDNRRGCNTCSFVPDPGHSKGSFAVAYLDPENVPRVPYNFIGSRRGRHAWENFAPLATNNLLSNKTNIPSMFPVNILARFSLFADMNTTTPTVPQQTLWAEIWRNEAVNVSQQPSCEDPTALEAHLRAWDAGLRAHLRASVTQDNP